MGLEVSTLVLLAVIVGVAYTAEAALGFGCNILALTLAARWVPLEQLVPVVVLLNLVVGAVILARHWRRVDRGSLFGVILPWAGLGLPVGLGVFLWAPAGMLTRGFGGLVVVLAAVELWRLSRAADEPAPSVAAGRAALIGAGFFHGLYACGGPLLVWWASRTLPDKGAFRATLTAVWLVMNLPLVIGYAWDGRLDPGTLEVTAWLLGPTVLGIVAGEWLHGRLAEGTFLVGVYALVGAGGILLVIG